MDYRPVAGLKASPLQPVSAQPDPWFNFMRGKISCTSSFVRHGTAGYLNHDIDDLGLYGFEKILSKRIVGEFFERHKVPTEDSKYEVWHSAKQNFLTLLIADGAFRVKAMVRDAVDASIERINRVVNEKLAFDAERLVEFSPKMRETRNLFYHFFKECVYADIRIKHRNELAKTCVEFLFDFFNTFFSGNPDLLPMHIQSELDSKPPWWHTYLGQVSVVVNATGAEAIVTRESDLVIACKLAAADIVADLTDREALTAAESLDKVESTVGMDVLDRILSTFPNHQQANLNREQQSATHRELQSLFPVVGNS